jgi:3-deoxy-manno-octulosonate cytidylyltransferase (CMP-KDO synthetase)
MTHTSHRNGTERCAEVGLRREADYYVNIQGDEPFIQPAQIDTLCGLLDGHTELGTLVKKIEDPALLHKPTVMKVVFNHQMEALYFSRACIPFVRDKENDQWLSAHPFYKHIGIYAYRKDVLQEVSKLPASALEKAENLEQLRWLENGYKIKIAETPFESIGIDTPEDIALALDWANRSK